MCSDQLQFITFAIDPGQESGWGIAVCAEAPVEIGVASTPSERIAACTKARQIMDEMRLPVVVIAEQWTIGGPRAHYKMFIGLGKNYGKWLDHIEGILGVKEEDIVRPTPQMWRNGLFGNELVREHSVDDGEGLKRLACAYVSGDSETPVVNHNAAEGGCIACWGQCSEEGAAAAEKAIRKSR